MKWPADVSLKHDWLSPGSKSLQNGVVLVHVREMDWKTASGRNEHDGYPEPAAKRHSFSDFTREEEASVLAAAAPTKTKHVQSTLSTGLVALWSEHYALSIVLSLAALFCCSSPFLKHQQIIFFETGKEYWQFS